MFEFYQITFVNKNKIVQHSVPLDSAMAMHCSAARQQYWGMTMTEDNRAYILNILILNMRIAFQLKNNNYMIKFVKILCNILKLLI